MSFQPSVLVRADSGPAAGFGHLARCLALMQTWIDRGGAATLVAADPPFEWAERFRREGCEILQPTGPMPATDWIVVDGYGLRTDDSPTTGAHRLRIDDHGTSPHEAADLVLDQNVGASADAYPLASHVLVGPRYALLRRGLADRAGLEFNAGRRGPLIVSLGGSPTPEVRAFARTVLESDMLVDALVDGFVDSWTEPGDVMPHASLALAAGGTTCLELALFGVPMALISVADNQVPVATALAERGAGVYLGPVPGTEAGDAARALADLARDVDRRAEMARVCRSLVDGLGSQRVVSRMFAALLELRDANEADGDLIYRWSNDPATRKASFSSEPIAWSDHLDWMRARLADPNAMQFIATDLAGDLVGLVRFDCARDTAVISIVVAPERRGRGWGPALIEAGCSEVTSRRPSTRVVAKIRHDNIASQRAFVAADFDQDPSIDGHPLEYTRWFDERRTGH